MTRWRTSRNTDRICSAGPLLVQRSLGPRRTNAAGSKHLFRLRTRRSSNASLLPKPSITFLIAALTFRGWGWPVTIANAPKRPLHHNRERTLPHDQDELPG